MERHSGGKRNVNTMILAALLATSPVWAAPPASQPTDRPVPSSATLPATRPAGNSSSTLPEVSYEDLALLVQTARRSFREAVLGKPERGVIYRPRGLAGLRAILRTTLRSNGVALVSAQTRDMEVVDAAVAVGVLLARAVRARKALLAKPEVRSGGDTLGLEFEWIGPPEYQTVQFEDHTRWPEKLLHAFEGGREGVGVVFHGKVGRTPPSAVIARNHTPDLALIAAEEMVGLTALDKERRPADIRYFRFQTYHLWQPKAWIKAPYRLIRGEELVRQEAVSKATVDAAIKRIGSYLCYRQNENGWFSYQYAPSGDRYLDEDAASAQLHAFQALTAYAKWSGRPDVRAGVVAGLRAANGKLQEVRHRPASQPAGRAAAAPPVDASAGPVRLVLHLEGHGHHLELSARYLLSLLSLDGLVEAADGDTLDVASFDDERAGLVEALLASQRPDGKIQMRFAAREAETTADQEEAAWALLALAKSSAWRADPRIERTIYRALPYYRQKVAVPSIAGTQREASAVATAELARAFAAGYDLTNDARTSDFVFEIVDQFVRLQLTSANCPWPELQGAINVRERGAVGADTAWYLTALADGLALAERVGDRVRIERYQAAVSAAVRFVLQLEFRDAGCYYLRSRRDALGGIRVALWDNQIRINHCAESLIALMRAREVLFGSRCTPTNR